MRPSSVINGVTRSRNSRRNASRSSAVMWRSSRSLSPHANEYSRYAVRPSKGGPVGLLDRFHRRQTGTSEETNPAVRGLRLLALLRRGEDLTGLDQAGDIGGDDRGSTALQHLANHHKRGFRQGLDRVPRAEGKTSSRTDDAMHLPEAAPPLDERVAEARQDSVE